MVTSEGPESRSYPLLIYSNSDRFPGPSWFLPRRPRGTEEARVLKGSWKFSRLVALAFRKGAFFKEIIDGRPGPKTSQKRFGPIRYPDIFGDLKYMIRILLLGFTYDESRVNGCGMYETRE